MMILKLNYVFPFLFFSFVLIGQGNIPIDTIKALSTSVDIRVGEDYFVKGGWHLDPSAKPDIFRIGSKWNYDSLAVSFITEIDSLTIYAKPGSKFDFIVALNGDTECHIQILTSPNPMLMNWSALLVLCFIFCPIIFLLFKLSKPKHIICMLYFGLIAPVLFWITTIIGGSMHEGYKHHENVISELGAIGTTGELFTSISFIVISIFSLIFSVGFYKASKSLNITIVPPLLTIVMPISFLWASIFPLGNEFHGLLGASPLLLIVGALYGSWSWKQCIRYIKLSNWSCISGMVMFLIVLRFVRPFGQEFEGLIQRFFYVGWTIWFFILSIELMWRMRKSLVPIQ